jgi:glucoamylase
MPLCWAHAEYLTLVRSRQKGECFDRIEPVYERYAKNKTASRLEIWTFAYQCPQIRSGKNLRIITSAPATIRWSFDEWNTTQDTEAIATDIGCWFTDLAAANLEPGAEIVFTFEWIGKSDGNRFRVVIAK